MAKFRKWYYPKESGVHQNLKVEAYSFKDAHTSTQLSFGFDRGNSEINFTIAIWRLFALFLVYEGSYAPKWEKDLPYNQWAKELSVRFFDGSMWINLWENPDGSCRGCRQYCINPMDILFGRTKYHEEKLMEPIAVELAMPEKTYTVFAEKTHCWWTRPRLPFWRKDVERVELECDEGIGIPGKGESSWDLDDDAVFSQSCPAETIEEALEILRTSIMRRREQYGGTDWIPEAYR